MENDDLKMGTEPYFSHDISCRQDSKIKYMLHYYRNKQESKEKALAAIGLYWCIVEDMHKDIYPEKMLESFADDYRCDVDFLREILENFGLFKKENGCYISDRVLRNLKEKEERSQKGKELAGKRWHKLTAEEEKEVKEIIEIFDNEFDKETFASQKTKSEIIKINKKNKLTKEIWNRIFQNAKRGWNIDGNNIKPTLEKILENWDKFASDDYYLAPDIEGRKKHLEEINEKEAAEKELFEKAQKKVIDKDSAINFLNTYFCMPEKLLKTSKLVKSYMEKYDFSVSDILTCRRKAVNE